VAAANRHTGNSDSPRDKACNHVRRNAYVKERGKPCG